MKPIIVKSSGSDLSQILLSYCRDCDSFDMSLNQKALKRIVTQQVQYFKEPFSFSADIKQAVLELTSTRVPVEISNVLSEVLQLYGKTEKN